MSRIDEFITLLLISIHSMFVIGECIDLEIVVAGKVSSLSINNTSTKNCRMYYVIFLVVRTLLIFSLFLRNICCIFRVFIYDIVH